MKKNLDQLSIQEFVNMLCGDIDVLKDSRKEILTKDRAKEIVRNLLLEYREITSPGGLRTYMIETSNLMKERGRVILYTICHILINSREYNRVKAIFEDIGIKSKDYSKERITAEVASRLAKAKDNVAKLESEIKEEDSTPNKIRKEFDTQTASLMAHFKFQINPLTMSASIYANLVARFDRDIKELSARVNKIKHK